MTGLPNDLDLCVVFCYNDASNITCPVNLIATSDQADDKTINLREYIIMPKAHQIEKPLKHVEVLFIQCRSKGNFDFKLTYEFFVD
jgi:hypothetical protein